MPGESQGLASVTCCLGPGSGLSYIPEMPVFFKPSYLDNPLAWRSIWGERSCGQVLAALVWVERP